MITGYTHHLIWIAKARDGFLAGLELIRDYPCFDDARTRAHITALMRADDVSHVHLVEAV